MTTRLARKLRNSYVLVNVSYSLFIWPWLSLQGCAVTTGKRYKGSDSKMLQPFSCISLKGNRKAGLCQRRQAQLRYFLFPHRGAFALRLPRPQHQLAGRTALASAAGVSVFLLRTKTGVARPGRGEEFERFARRAFTAQGTLVDSGALSKSSARPSDVAARASTAPQVPASGGTHASQGRWPPACLRKWPGRAVA